jgi:hypothetical protein
MKKVLFAAFLLVSSNAIFAQVNKGQWLVGGNVSFESIKHGDGKATKFTASPNAGYFFIDNFAGGLRFELTSTKVKNADDADSRWSLSPFLRYYFLPATQKVNVFADASYGFGKDGMAEKESFNQFAIMAGPAIFLTPNTALEFALGYKSYGGDFYKIGGKEERENHFGINIGFQIHLGGGAKK